MLAVGAQIEVARTITAGQIYIVPRPTELVIGSTTRLTGYDDEVTANGIAQLLSGALRIVPAIAEANVLRWVRRSSRVDNWAPIVATVPDRRRSARDRALAAESFCLRSRPGCAA
jgi:hypothetical protein